MEAFLESLGTPGPALFAVAGLFALAFLAGRPWARRLGELDPAERAAVGLILGLDLVALALHGARPGVRAGLEIGRAHV